ncbi:uncharacterized protein MONBRDRAFT_29680 [Monosiga brevicollis MX1]|uniref:Sugar phosphate transporter domain-containing protein n=1 Tax=Monosiga brevicollis TaxID=81824 RepID=A9VBT9_MONBE|nr:uncharacterized protein MONBRDRAFT_29680 [Monosiga brevicollis MX1]EDQ84990.1 predicted protein [Monosiga brevicollis MX1]|eukprot:XP_001750160.1 hypothetical protein [Monosiga brevicollis MX1]
MLFLSLSALSFTLFFSLSLSLSSLFSLLSLFLPLFSLFALFSLSSLSLLSLFSFSLFSLSSLSLLSLSLSLSSLSLFSLSLSLSLSLVPLKLYVWCARREVAGWRPNKNTIKAMVICIIWYSGSAINGIAGKRMPLALENLTPCSTSRLLPRLCFTTSLFFLFLAAPALPIMALRMDSAMKHFPYPTTVSFVQLVVINTVLPLFRTTKLLVTLSSQLSILKVPVSYAHTVKALMPIFTVVLSRIFLRQSHSWAAYLSLVPIMAGVVISSVTELEFNMIGLVSALFSTFIFAVQNIFSKKVMKAGVDHISILIVVSRVSLVMLLPFWFFHEGFAIMTNSIEEHLSSSEMWSIWGKLFLSALGNSFQTIFAFTFLSLVTPVTYSVANVGKRVVIIVLAMIVFRNPVTWQNLIGISIAMLGIAMYNKAKLDEKAQASAIAAVSKQLPLRMFQDGDAFNNNTRYGGLNAGKPLPFEPLQGVAVPQTV